ncbi:MAG: peptidylprolyl isomerase [Luteolibacter sp.]|uniref:peptidylprolyl isomerase n=1 Tax=Luteolibacter sp. TaxID=1962973 RepID=UPI0032647BFB
MRKSIIETVAIACLLTFVSCKQETRNQAVSTPPSTDDGVLLRVGSVTVTQEDLAYQLKEKHAGRTDAESRQTALDELTERARFNQAAHDAGIDTDPIARAEISRILISRLREKELNPKLKAAASEEIPEVRLREIYESRKDQFQSAEKRRIAVLWLDPGADSERLGQYQAKLAQAREWYFSNGDLVAHPDQGFSVLSVDYSEHAATRYKDGVLGWLERQGGADPWNKAVAEIAFSLEKPGEVSAVISRPEGVFLVRCMAVEPAFVRPFESVSRELEQSERQRIRTAVEADFDAEIKARYPTSLLVPAAPNPQVAITP